MNPATIFVLYILLLLLDLGISEFAKTHTTGKPQHKLSAYQMLIIYQEREGERERNKAKVKVAFLSLECFQMGFPLMLYCLSEVQSLECSLFCPVVENILHANCLP